MKDNKSLAWGIHSENTHSWKEFLDKWPFFELYNKKYCKNFAHFKWCWKCLYSLVRDINSYIDWMKNVQQPCDIPLYIEWLEKVLENVKFDELNKHQKTFYKILDGLRYIYYHWSIPKDDDFYHESIDKDDEVYFEYYYNDVFYYDFDSVISYLLKMYEIRSIKDDGMILWLKN